MINRDESSTRQQGGAIRQDLNRAVARKLRHHRRPFDRRWVSFQQTAYSRLANAVPEALASNCGKRAILLIAPSAYREIVQHAREVASDWPTELWRSMRSLVVRANAAMMARGAVGIDGAEFVMSSRAEANDRGEMFGAGSRGHQQND